MSLLKHLLNLISPHFSNKFKVSFESYQIRDQIPRNKYLTVEIFYTDIQYANLIQQRLIIYLFILFGKDWVKVLKILTS